jgi:hypothetical protein
MRFMRAMRFYKWVIFLVFIGGLVACSISQPQVSNRPSLVEHINDNTVLPTSQAFPGTTPTYTTYTTLLAKVAAVGPLYATGDPSVSQEALADAGLNLAEMLHSRPDIAETLREHGAFIAVASHNEHICDLRYFSMYDSQLCASYGQGGAGGTEANPVTACHEKNLLKDPADAYDRGHGVYSQNICVHELAHMIMNVGLSGTDFVRITDRYEAAHKAGLWTKDYADTNAAEFWAVMSQFYFSAGPSATYAGAFYHIANGPRALKAYDPATFALLDSIYRGTVNLS